MMTQKAYLAIFLFGMISLMSCKKDDIPSDIRQKLANKVWVHTAPGQTDSPMEHVPVECEEDNEYTFHFGNSIHLHIDRKDILCEGGNESWFERRFDSNSIRFTYDEKSEVLIFNRPYEGFKIELQGEDRLTLSYQNTNPMMDYFSVRYHFTTK